MNNSDKRSNNTLLSYTPTSLACSTTDRSPTQGSVKTCVKVCIEPARCGRLRHKGSKWNLLKKSIARMRVCVRSVDAVGYVDIS